jgi:hypothetical protein
LLPAPFPNPLQCFKHEQKSQQENYDTPLHPRGHLLLPAPCPPRSLLLPPPFPLLPPPSFLLPPPSSFLLPPPSSLLPLLTHYSLSSTNKSHSKKYYGTTLHPWGHLSHLVNPIQFRPS